MATTAQQVLLSAADDLLRQIVRFLDAQSIQRLSHTCPRMKTRLLSGTMVESLRFVYFVQTRQLPKFVSTYSRLSELVLVLPCFDRRFLRVEQSFLNYLPPTLRKLHFRFPGCHTIWYKGFSVGPSPQFQTTKLFCNEYGEPLDLVKMLPNISEMRLGGENRGAAMRLIQFLPNTLTVFVAYLCRWSMDWPNENHIAPPNLRLFKSDMASTLRENVFHLNPPLETLILTRYRGTRPFKYMPITLTHLDMEQAKFEGLRAEDFAWVAPLVNLTKVKFSDTRILPYLSDKLQLQTLDLKCDLTSSQARLLPPNLTELVMACLLIDPFSYDIWPSGLIHLQFLLPGDGTTIPSPDSLFWTQLPKTLTFLDVKTGSGPLYSVPMTQWPPQLKTIQREEQEAPQVSDFGSHKHLTELKIRFLNWSASTPYKVVLLDGLRKFSWSVWWETPLTIATDGIQLPSTLTSITLIYCSEIDNQWMKQLPRGLIDLTIQLYYGTQASIDEEGLLDLPPFLSTICVHMKPNSDASVFLPKLPKSLKSISLCRIVKIEDSLFAHLPEGLTHLQLPNIQGLTDAALPHLPRSLTELLIPRNYPITPEAFFALKLPFLRFFDFRKNPNFTRKKVLALAPPLLGFKTKKITREWDYYSDAWWQNENL